MYKIVLKFSQLSLFSYIFYIHKRVKAMSPDNKV